MKELLSLHKYLLPKHQQSGPSGRHGLKWTKMDRVSEMNQTGSKYYANVASIGT